MPFNSDVGLLHYRRDHLSRIGADASDLTSWKSLQELHPALQSELRDEAYQYVWTTQFGPYEGRTVNGIEAFATAVDDVSLVYGNGRYSADEAQLEAGLDELKNRTHDSYLLPHARTSYEADSLDDFTEGKTAFLRHWPYAYRTLHQSLDEKQLGVAPLPGKAALGGQNLAVAQASKRSRAATELIEFLTGPDSERRLLDAGFAATRKSAYDDAEVTCTAAAAPGGGG
ncbi:extracellular solute-binding protein, partial [Streptomyces sp. T-3]|nr:extracellular solute-binding protein [Streptomyces sp. T-3]